MKIEAENLYGICQKQGFGAVFSVASLLLALTGCGGGGGYSSAADRASDPRIDASATAIASSNGSSSSTSTSSSSTTSGGNSSGNTGGSESSGTATSSTTSTTSTTASESQLYSISIDVRNIPSNSSVALELNGAETLTIERSSTTSFSLRLATGAPYQIVARSQPNGYVCTVGSGSGIVGKANITTQVLCKSNDQHLFENFALANGGGFSEIQWSLSGSGLPAVGSARYFQAFSTSLSESLAISNGSSLGNVSTVNLAHTLSASAELTGSTGYLKSGAIAYSPSNPQFVKLSYLGTGIRRDALGMDKSTVLKSEFLYAFSYQPLIDSIAQSPAELIQYFETLYSNPLLLNKSATWQSGAGYLKFSGRPIGDFLAVRDCSTGSLYKYPPSQPNFASCANGKALSDFIIAKYPANGVPVITTFEGVQVWIAPPSASNVSLAYFELAGNIYLGSFLKDGQTYLTPRYDYLTTTYVDWLPAFNKAALDSYKAAAQF